MEQIGIIESGFNTLLQFFLPGFISVWVFRRLYNNRQDETQGNQLWGICIVLSIFYQRAISFLLKIFHITLSIGWIVFLEILVAALVSVLCIFLIRNRRVRKFINSINHTMIAPTVFKANLVYDEKAMPNVVILRKDGMAYSGRLLQNGTDDHDQWLVLDCARITKGETVIRDYEENMKRYERVLLPIADIEHMIVRYPKGHELYPAWWDGYAKEKSDDE